MASTQASLNLTSTGFLTSNSSTTAAATEPMPLLNHRTLSVNPIWLTHGMVFAALGVMAFVSFCSRRSSYKRNCCDARPAPIIPVNLVDNYKDRWFYAFCYGAMSSALAQLFLGSGTKNLGYEKYISLHDHQYAYYAAKIVAILEISVIYYPQFSCINVANVWIGSLAGLMYSWLWLAISIYMLYLEVEYGDTNGGGYLAGSIPTLFCIFLIAARYGYYFFSIWIYPFFKQYVLKQDVFHKNEKSGPKLACGWHIRYTRGLFNPVKPNAPIPEGNIARIKDFIVRRILENRPEFKFSTRMICCYVSVIIVTYQGYFRYDSIVMQNLTLSVPTQAYTHSLAISYFQVIVPVIAIISSLAVKVLIGGGLPPDSFVLPNLASAPNIICITLKVFGSVTALWFFIKMVFVLYRYREDMLRMFRGKRNEFIPKELSKRLASNSIVSCSITFTGCQVAYMIYGYMLTNLFFFGLILGVSFIVILIKFSVTFWIPPLAIYFLVSLAIGLLFRWLQYILSTYVFLQEKLKVEDEAQPLALDNWKGYHVAAFFLWLSNIILGIFACLLRIVQDIVLGLIFMGRMDRCLLIPGFEHRDQGYRYYIGMLYMEYTHTHPVLRTFCHILAGTREFSSNNYPSQNVSLDLPWRKTSTVVILTDVVTENTEYKMENVKISKAKSRVRRRWFLLYTLLRNPQLIEDRRQDTSKLLPVFNIEDVQLRSLHKQYALHKTAIRKIEEKLFQLNELEKIEPICQKDQESESSSEDNSVTYSDHKPPVD